MVQIITSNSGGGGGVGVYKYKGSVDYYEDLPTSGMKIGDTYNVVNAFTKDGKDYPAGTNVAWTGTDWDALGGSIDLSDYQKKLVEGDGIDLDQDTNEISVESSIISGAAAGATAVQPGDLAAVATSGEYCDLNGRPTIGDGKLTVCVNGLCKNEFTANQTANVGIDIGVPTCTSQLSNDSGYIDNTVSDLCNYTLSSNLCAVATSGKYCDLSGRVTDNCQIANSCGFITNSALTSYAKCCDIPTDNCQLSNGCGYTTCTGTLVASDIANLAQCCDIPTDNCQLLNGCGYTTCTGTVVATDLAPYAKSCDLCTVATSGNYCDLTGLPTIPTDNCQLANGCGYTTCTGTVVASDLTPYAKSADLCTVATSGLYCDLTGTPTIPTDNCQLSNGCGYAKASTLCTVATTGKYCDLTGTPTIGSGTLTIQKNGTCVDTFSANATANKTINIIVPTDNCQLGNSCGYTTCTGTVVASDLTPYAKSCDLCTVATTGKYCDLTGKPTIPTVIDNLCSSCTTEALSAKQGCILNARLDTVEARGRFLSNWNATTGQPVSFPEAIPYTYSTGDYYDVTVVGATNYKPSGTSYTGAASTAVETGDLEIGDTYVYDGTNWLLQQNHNITTSFSSISGSPYDNTCLASALGDKANISSLCAVATSGKYCDLTGTPTIPTDNCQLANSCNYITSSALSGYQLTCNMVCNLSGADNTHYPTAKAVADALSSCGAGDMLKSVYDPNNISADAFDYTNFINTPTLCTVATSGKYCDLTGTPSLCTVATSGKYCDLTGTPTIPAAQIQSDWTQTCNTCKDYIKNKPSLCAVATSGKYCDLSGTPTIPTNNNQLTNGCGYTTCTGTVVASDLAPYALSSSLCAVATSGKYCDLTGTPTIPAAQIQSDWTQSCSACKDYIKNKPSLCAVATSGKYCDLTGTPTIPTNNNQLANGCGYTTCTGTLVASDLTPYAKTCDLKAVATSGKYCDLTGTPTIGTATLTIQKNGVQVQTFGANATSNVTANITVPTNTCELTNGAGFITGISSSDVTTALGYTPANDNCVVKTSGNQTVCGTKTFTTSPVVPSKTTAATNTGTAIATEAQVYLKANSSDVLTKTNTNSFTPTGDYNPATKKYVDDAIAGASGNSTPSSFLAESGVVGELYTSSDFLFIQNTPELVNSILGANVGDTNNNKEIHIQRIGSGTESNQLKLNLKKVGSPTKNLIVEVREGVKIESGTEAYWYGGTVIASGSVAYGNITTSYSEITITLNANFGGTKGQLLDVVVYQADSTVNGSNYFVVGCDNTQYSEGFNYVSVNGSTRTRNNLMPYCISDGFVSSILSKVDADVDYPYILNIISDTSSASYSVGGTHDGTFIWSGDVYTKTFTGGGVISVSIGIQAVNWHGYRFGARVVIDGVATENSYTDQGGGVSKTITFTQTISSGTHTITIQLGACRSNLNSVSLKTINVQQTSFKLVKSRDRYGKAISSYNIGETGITNIFGEYGDDFFIGRKTSTTATTGSITPGDFVGYLEIGDYKIPYYSK